MTDCVQADDGVFFCNKQRDDGKKAHLAEAHRQLVYWQRDFRELEAKFAALETSFDVSQQQTSWWAEKAKFNEARIRALELQIYNLETHHTAREQSVRAGKAEAALAAANGRIAILEAENRYTDKILTWEGRAALHRFNAQGDCTVHRTCGVHKPVVVSEGPESPGNYGLG